MDARRAGTGRVEVDVHGVGCEAGGVPRNVEWGCVFDGLARRGGFVESASVTRCEGKLESIRQGGERKGDGQALALLTL